MARLTETYNLQAVNPSLAREWHPTKNEETTPTQVTPRSPHHAWWICEKGHEWKAIIYTRNNGTGCPYCSGRRPSPTHCLASSNPSLARQWHPVKNGSLTPYDVTPMSGKRRWWICAKGHEWYAEVAGRMRGRGCPYCIGRGPDRDNRLSSRYPDLARQWHPVNNGILTPFDVTVGSGRKVWWVCDKGHEWEASIVHRRDGKGCPYCRGILPREQNILSTRNPELAKEWHPARNGSLTPSDITIGSEKKAWWVCGKGHEWEAVISRRHGGTSCPYCSYEKKYHRQATFRPFLKKGGS
jgi:hypothetical protein